MVGCVRRAATLQRATTHRQCYGLSGHQCGHSGHQCSPTRQSGQEAFHRYQLEHHRHDCAQRETCSYKCTNCKPTREKGEQSERNTQRCRECEQRGRLTHSYVCRKSETKTELTERQRERNSRHECLQSEPTGLKRGHSELKVLKCAQRRPRGVQSERIGQKCDQTKRNRERCVQSAQPKCGQLWKRGRFLLIVLLSLLSVRSSGGSSGVSLGAQLVCARSPGLTDRQRALCRAAPAAMAAIGDGLRMAYAECAWQMRGRRWNCTGVSDGRHFGHVIARGTKEAAYTYAITSAGVTHALSAACARGELPACGCTDRGRAAAGDQWQWGGGRGGARCGGGEAARGARFARRFLDARELEHDARALMNLHNNRLGRKLVKELVTKECKCHGVSGSCAVRTCWRALPPFRAVAAALTRTYLHAKKVVAYERGTTVDGRVNLQLVVKKAQKPASMSRAPRRAELVYLEPSPAYCEPSPAHAALGTHQRHCNHTSRGEDGCAHLCCGRGFSSRRVVTHAQCRCTFHWCCRVRCDTCLVTTLHHVCN